MKDKKFAVVPMKKTEMPKPDKSMGEPLLDGLKSHTKGNTVCNKFK